MQLTNLKCTRGLASDTIFGVSLFSKLAHHEDQLLETNNTCTIVSNTDFLYAFKGALQLSKAYYMAKDMAARTRLIKLLH